MRRCKWKIWRYTSSQLDVGLMVNNGTIHLQKVVDIICSTFFNDHQFFSQASLWRIRLIKISELLLVIVERFRNRHCFNSITFFSNPLFQILLDAGNSNFKELKVFNFNFTYFYLTKIHNNFSEKRTLRTLSKLIFTNLLYVLWNSFFIYKRVNHFCGRDVLRFEINTLFIADRRYTLGPSLETSVTNALLFKLYSLFTSLSICYRLVFK